MLPSYIKLLCKGAQKHFYTFYWEFSWWLSLVSISLEKLCKSEVNCVMQKKSLNEA